MTPGPTLLLMFHEAKHNKGEKKAQISTKHHLLHPEGTAQPVEKAVDWTGWAEIKLTWLLTPGDDHWSVSRMPSSPPTHNVWCAVRTSPV